MVIKRQMKKKKIIFKKKFLFKKIFFFGVGGGVAKGELRLPMPSAWSL